MSPLTAALGGSTWPLAGKFSGTVAPAGGCAMTTVGSGIGVSSAWSSLFQGLDHHGTERRRGAVNIESQRHAGSIPCGWIDGVPRVRQDLSGDLPQLLAGDTADGFPFPENPNLFRRHFHGELAPGLGRAIG